MLWTIGHSTLPWDQFQGLLEQHRIGCIADVRSYPRSRYAHFSSPAIRVLLNRVGVSYVFLGDQLGGRPRSGPDRYEEMAQTPFFRTGIERLLEIAPRTRLAIMCSEGQPLECHRLLLVARYLAGCGVKVEHIHRDGTTTTQHDAEEQLIARLRSKPDLFSNREQRVAEGYRKQELRLRGETA